MLRRRKDTQLDGQPLIQLPEKEVVMEELVFSEKEQVSRSLLRFLRRPAR